MKRLLLIAFSLCFASAFAQTTRTHVCAQGKIRSFKSNQLLSQRVAATSSAISHEKSYDMKFVHLMLNCERTTKALSGGVHTVATVTSTTLDTFMCLLHQVMIIDSVRLNGVLEPVIRQDSMVKAKLPSTLTTGQTIDAYVWYHGTPPNAPAAIGDGFSNGTSTSWGNQVTWSLSESLAAYQWWPCKQILTDKIDSSWVFVTTDSTNKVGSNGLLKNVVPVGSKKRYEWKSKHVIDYYLISVAIAKYKEYDLWAKPTYLPGDSIFIQNYIYDNAITSPSFISGQKVQLDRIKQTMELECNLYGMYPFRDEKYGHSMAPFSGGMEHQTMTSLGFFDFYVDAHELGHQWWGDNVTCKSWGDIFMNEAFAAYTEHLVAYYIDNTNFLPNLNAAHNSVMSQPGGMVFITGPDTMDANVIFDSRLTYDKGGSILRTLQFVVNNDSLWFNGLRSFQQTHKNSAASVQDFKTYMETYTSMNFTQFFNQWYYGQGYPTFTTTWNFVGGKAIVKVVQSTSMSSSVPLFITPIEYKLVRTSAPDTVVRVMHSNATENYTFAVLGTVTSVTVDPNQWIINKATVSKDIALGVDNAETVMNEISISPNPTQGIVNIRTKAALSGIAEVTDVTGKLLMKETLNGNIQLNLSDRSPGIYIVNVKDSEGKIIRMEKIIRN